MALPDTLIARFIETCFTHGLRGDFVMLGRQRWIGSRRGASAELLAETLHTYLPGRTEDSLRNEDDEYSETFFRALGFDTVDSMDVSAFEGASVIHDLGTPLPPALEARFDTVYDGGTCEHIFDLPAAYRNIHRMLRPGGTLVAHSPCNNWVNHGFYQVTPEIVHGFWEKAMGYEVLHVSLQPLRPNLARRVVTTTNPNVTGIRPRLSGDLPPNAPIILNYAVRKPQRTPEQGRKVYQTDYVERWQGDTAS
ncbi:methyltransferase domain-containing protein [Roseovarius salis]|uniref:methyltransferase domain-containing protein n=1 Tax=Roseovarius salis TaxID=3376063 RepID=UPI0037CA6479